ncbi:minor capsid protein [Alces alces papillomavirus 1]|uniref:Minor capsid protein L2 n=1 Tax=European elk papillomavirus TaxID=2885846 RepID=VL2_PAPVE|nr:minor capsid protein [Alces alces papillomavirus 1]P11327.1 RecName: Full=Minor capsid protein L2 [Alces alces papillomavirus 1]AAA66860.1 minor capsid protein [Alces alces papillomavirus 1]
MAPRRVKRANVYDLYRTCKQAGTCPPDVIPKVEGKTIADKILQYGSMGVYLGGLGIGTGSGKPGTGGYIPLRGGGSTTSLSSKPFAGGIPLETLEGIGAFRPGIVEDAGPALEGILPDAPAVVTPEAVPVDEGLSGLDISRELSQEQILSFLHPEGPDDIAVLEVRPTEHDQAHLLSTSTHPNPLFQGPVQQARIIAETSGAENVFVGGSGIGSNAGEDIELTLFAEPRTSTPEVPIKRSRGIFNWFSRRYYTQVPVEDPDEIAAAGSYVFENPVYDSKAFKPAQQPDITLQDEASVTGRDAARLLAGPSGRIGWSRITRPTSLGTRSGVRVGPLYHLRSSFSTIHSPETIELIPTVLEDDTEVLTGVPERDTGFDDVDLDSIASDSPLLPERHHLAFGARRSHIPIVARPGVQTGTVIDTRQMAENSVYVSDNGGQESQQTPTVVINGNINVSMEYFRHYYLHPSLLGRKRKRLFG